MQQTLGGGIASIALAARNVRHAMEFLVSQTDVKIQTQRSSDTSDDGFARPTTVSTAQQFADQPAVSDCGITVACARRPPWRLGREGIDHGLPVIQRFRRQQFTQRRQTGLMAEQLAQGHGFFAGSGEFRPIARNRNIQLQLAFTHQLQRGDSGKGFGAGEQIGDGVAVPGFGAVLVGGTDQRSRTVSPPT